MTAMDASLLKTIVAAIHRQYPEFSGCQPLVREQNTTQAKAAVAGAAYLLTFQSTATIKTGKGSKALPRTMRVMVDLHGKILKVSTSR